MENPTQEQINNFVRFITNTEEPESVDNETVGVIMAFLNSQIGLRATIEALGNEATARQNADALLQGLITALQTAMNGKADLQSIDNAKRLRFSQVPACFISYLTASASAPSGISANQTWLKKEGNNYTICYHTSEGDDVELGSPQYILYYNGNAIYRWGGSTLGAFVKIVDLGDYFSNGKLKSSALPDNLPSGGGMSDDIYNAIKTNIETLRSILYTLIKTWLANLAFTNGRPSDQMLSPIASAFNNWPSNGDGGEEPTPSTPSITLTSDGVTVGNDFTVGTVGENEPSVSKTIIVQGTNLTAALNISVEGDGFSVSPSLILRDAANANGGATITVTYNGSNTGIAVGTLTISSTGMETRTITLRASKASSQGGGDEPIPTLSVSPLSLSFSTEAGQPVQKTFTVVGNNLTGAIQIASNNNLFSVSPATIQPTNGNVETTVTVTYSPLAAGNHNGDITVSSTGVASKSINLLGTASAAASTLKVVYKLLNFNQPSGTTQDQVFGYYEETVDKSAEFNKALTAIQDAASNNDLTVKSGGVVKYKYGGSNNATGYAFSNGTLTITAAALALLTDDLIIEATACTGTVTVKANESGVTATIGGTTITCSTSNGDGTYSGSASGITSINSMSFSAKTKIVSIDFGGAKFTGSTLASAFSGCTALTQFKGLVVTNSVTSLANMFENCSSLILLEAIGWNMPSLTSLYAFLYKASNLTKFDASTWYAPNVANLHGMFASCNNLEEIDISGISTKYVNENAPNTMDIAHMFHLSPNNSNFSLTKLTIGEFDTSNVTNIESFFWLTTNASIELHCKSRTVPNISSTPSLIWFGNQSQTNNNRRFMIGSVYVPTGCRDAYYDEWGEYIGLTKEDFYEE